ncbi:MAG: hypothetical protein WCC48_08305, partial [Anaeromyxobacteraceae bacterium]
MSSQDTPLHAVEPAETTPPAIPLPVGMPPRKRRLLLLAGAIGAVAVVTLVGRHAWLGRGDQS